METIETLPFSIDRAKYAKVMTRRRFGRRVLIAMALVICWIAGVHIAVSFPLTWTDAAIVGAILVFLVVMRLVVVRRVVYSGKNAGLLGERSMKFSEETLELNTAAGVHSSVPWSQFQCSEQADEFFLLFMTPIQHFIVPTVAFKSAKDTQEFERLVARKTELSKVSAF